MRRLLLLLLLGVSLSFCNTCNELKVCFLANMPLNQPDDLSARKSVQDICGC